MRIKYFGLTDKGKVRETNEDSILLNELIINNKDNYVLESLNELEVKGNPLWFAVADGMGGYNAGEVASKITLEKLLKGFKEKANEYINSTDGLKMFIKSIHDDVNRIGKETGNTGMGSTLVGSIFNDKRLLLFNVGDSKVFIYRGGYLQQKTKDHSLKEYMQIDSPKNVIISSIGGGKDDIIIDIYDLSGKIKDNDLMLLCSDGLFDIDMDKYYDAIEDVIGNNKADLSQLCKQLLTFSLEKGSRDNISLIAVLFSL